MQRHFFSGAVQAQPDKLGRVVIPQYLRAYAGLETEVVVVGLADRVEVWATGEWQRERSQAEADSADLAEHLAQGGP
jgi:MraZ protein